MQSVHRGKPEDAKEESNDKSEEQGESPTLRETETAPELKKQKTGFVLTSIHTNILEEHMYMYISFTLLYRKKH